jgi:alpha-tubulin suppressor-like RCC1 family protein
VALGDGATVTSTVPVPVAGGRSYSTITAGFSHACAVEEGTARIWCWGRNDTGELGDNSIVHSGLPVQVMSEVSFAEVAAGNHFTCATTTGGLVYCWGSGRGGQLGFPVPFDPGHELTPQQVPDLSGASRIAAGRSHACMIASGTLVCWGSGRLGVTESTPTGGHAPTAVPGLFSVTDVSIASLGDNTCAIDNASLYCWGLNSSGQLGDGTFTDRISPVAVGLSGVTNVAVGGSVTCALQSTGLISCFGSNAAGAVGAPWPYVPTPARVF